MGARDNVADMSIHHLGHCTAEDEAQKMGNAKGAKKMTEGEKVNHVWRQGY